MSVVGAVERGYGTWHLLVLQQVSLECLEEEDCAFLVKYLPKRFMVWK